MDLELRLVVKPLHGVLSFRARLPADPRLNQMSGYPLLRTSGGQISIFPLVEVVVPRKRYSNYPRVGKRTVEEIKRRAMTWWGRYLETVPLLVYNTLEKKMANSKDHNKYMFDVCNYSAQSEKRSRDLWTPTK